MLKLLFEYIYEHVKKMKELNRSLDPHNFSSKIHGVLSEKNYIYRNITNYRIHLIALTCGVLFHPFPTNNKKANKVQ